MSNEAFITFTGNATADAEVRYTPQGAAVANVTVAVTPREKVGDQWQDGQAAFYRIAAWNKLAENVGNSVRKGDRVTIVGTLKPREYEKDGVKRLSLDVTADSVALDLRFATASAVRANNGGGGQSSGQFQQGGFQQAAPTGQFGAPAGGGFAGNDDPPF